jgi:hypothetical protein
MKHNRALLQREVGPGIESGRGQEEVDVMLLELGSLGHLSFKERRS